MSRTTVYVDELIREYLMFRGFTKTAQSLEMEIKFDKDKNMRADKITEHIFSYVYLYDLGSLRSYWNYLYKRFFRRISNTTIQNSLLKLETCLYKYYVVHAYQSGKPDKVTEFFDKLAPDLLNSPNKDSWKEWFSFQYLKNPETNSYFEPFFNKVWFDTFYMSLQNLISTVLDSVPLPTLLQWSRDGIFDSNDEKQKLQQEVNTLRSMLNDISIPSSSLSNLNTVEENAPLSKNQRGPNDMDDDFCIVSTGRSPDTGRLLHTEQPNASFTVLSPRDYDGHTCQINHAMFSNDGMFCATADIQGYVKVWAFSPDIKTLHTYTYKSGVYAVHWSRRYEKILYVGTGNGRVKVINITQRKVGTELTHTRDNAHVIAIESNNTGTFLVTSAAVIPPITTPPSTTTRPSNTTPSPLPHSFSELVIWEAKTLRLCRTLEVTPSPTPLLSLHYNHNGTLLVCGALDGMIRIYDMAEYQCIMGWQLDGYRPVLTVRFSVDDNTVFSYAEGVISQWRLYPMSQCLYRVTVNKTEPTTPLSFLPPTPFPSTSPRFALDTEGRYLLTSRGSQGVVYRVTEGIVEDTVLPTHGGHITCVDWHVPYSTRLCMCSTAAGFTRITELLLN